MCNSTNFHMNIFRPPLWLLVFFWFFFCSFCMKIWSLWENKMRILQSNSHGVGTTVWLYHLCSNETLGKKARRLTTQGWCMLFWTNPGCRTLQNNSCIVTYFSSYKTCWELLVKLGWTHKQHSPWDSLDCNLEVRKFELQSCYYIHLQTNTLIIPLFSKRWVK